MTTHRENIRVLLLAAFAICGEVVTRRRGEKSERRPDMPRSGHDISLYLSDIGQNTPPDFERVLSDIKA